MSNTFYTFEEKLLPAEAGSSSAHRKAFSTALAGGAVDRDAVLRLHDQVPPVHQELDEKADVPLEPQGAAGLVREQLVEQADRRTMSLAAMGRSIRARISPARRRARAWLASMSPSSSSRPGDPPVGHNQLLTVQTPQLLPALHPHPLG